MKIDEKQLSTELENNPHEALKYAQMCDSETLDKCFDILIKKAKHNITLRSAEWYTHYNGTYNSTSLLESTIKEVNKICDLYKICKEEFSKAYAKKHGKKYKAPTAKELESEHYLQILEIHKLAQKLSEIYLDSLLGDISFKSVEKFNENMFNQPGNN